MADFNLDRLRSDWIDGLDVERAVAESGRFFARVVEGGIDPVEYVDYFDLGLDAQFDGGGDRRVALNALRVAKQAFRAAEAISCHSDHRVRLRWTLIQWEAQSMHRLGNYGLDAVNLAYAGLFLLEQETDAPTGLLQALGSWTSNVVAEYAVGLVGVLAAAIRRADFDEDTHERLVAYVRMLFGAYALNKHTPVTYKRSLAIAAQPFYLFASEGHAEDKPFVEAAYALDVASRAPHARDQATIPLRDYTYARYHGDIEAAQRHGQAAVASLADFWLPRHLEVISQRGFIAA
jgi:hypothetical protein